MELEKEAVVISGISCRLPESDSVEEFRSHLVHGEDMVTANNLRWESGHNGFPTKSGTLKDLTKFDAGFFGIPPKLADVMDPQLRMLLEVAYEAFVDAGVSTEEMKRSQTGVFVGTGLSESLEAYVSDQNSVNGYAPIGCSSSMFSNRLSYAFDLTGPSYTFRNGSGSGILAIEQAVTSIRLGDCSAALVGGSNICLKAAATLQMMKLDHLSPNGLCHCCDQESCGTNRSEGIVVMLLQKQTLAKRSYCCIRHIKCQPMTNTVNPLFQEEVKFLQDVYREAGIDPLDVCYVELNGSCSREADTQEVNSIKEVFCSDRKTPLLIGSVKSNVGDTEAVSGLVSIVKLLLASQDEMMPANLHFSSDLIPSLHDNSAKMVTERSRWKPGIVGINCYGLGNVNSHSILDFSPPTDFQKQIEVQSAMNLERRLAVYSATTEEGVRSMLNLLEKHHDNICLHSLLNEISRSPPPQHRFRGYSILNSGQKHKEIQKSGSSGRPLWYIFSGMGSQWPSMGRKMMKLDLFRRSIMNCDAVLRQHGISVYDIIMEGGDKVYDKCLHSFMAISSIQVALVDLLRSVGLEPDGIVGHSVGELGCGYADRSLTMEETVLAAYWRGTCIQEANLPPGGMAAVGLTWKEAMQQCPEGVVPACHNSERTVTISGPVDDVKNFVQTLKDRQVFAREVNSSGVAFHSYFMNQVAPALKSKLEEVIIPKERSKRWISSSVPEPEWDSDLAKTSSAEYIINNITHPVLFQEALKHVPSDAVVIEIAPHCLLQGVLKKSLGPECTIIPLMKKDHDDNVDFFLSNLGRCYIQGVNMNPLRMLVPASFPVPHTTPRISSHVKWDHSNTWQVPKPENFLSGGTGRNSESSFEIEISPESTDHFLTGHCIDGRVLFPATGYLVLAWRALARLKGKVFDRMPVIFKNVSIHRATVLPSQGIMKFDVTLVSSTGEFEVCENDGLVVSGEIDTPPEPPRTISDDTECIMSPKSPVRKGQLSLDSADVYKELRLRGYEYGLTFQGILKASNRGDNGELLWSDNWISFLDTMMQINLLTMPDKGLVLPTGIKYLSVNPLLHRNKILPIQEHKMGLFVMVDKFAQTTVSGGVEMQGLMTKKAPRKKTTDQAVLEESVFVPYEENGKSLSTIELKSYCLECVRLVRQVLLIVQKCGGSQKYPKEVIQGLLDETCDDSNQTSEVKKWRDKVDNSLILALKKLSSLPPTDKFLTTVENILSVFKNDLLKDKLLSNHLQPRVLKTCLDVVLENVPADEVHVVEIGVSTSHLYTDILQFFHASPGLQLNYTVTDTSLETFDQSELEKSGIDVAIWDIKKEPPADLEECSLLIACNTFHDQEDLDTSLKNISKLIKDNGFLLVSEITHNAILPATFDVLYGRQMVMSGTLKYRKEDFWENFFFRNGFQLIAKKSDGLLVTTFLLRKIILSVPHKILSVSGSHYKWLTRLKEEMGEISSQPNGHNLWLVTDSAETSGIVGLVNCLRKEAGGEKIRCLYTMDEQNTLEKIPDDLIKKDLVMNVSKGGVLGSFRHLPIKPLKVVNVEDSYLIPTDKTFTWTQLAEPNKTELEECAVYYSALYVKDKYSTQESNGFGTEFSGITRNGRRVMGIHQPSVATTAFVDRRHILDIPENWSLRDSATVLWAYGIALHSLVLKGKITPESCVLIVDGHTDIGIAATSVALHYGCDLLVTVPNPDRSLYILSVFEKLRSKKVLVASEHSSVEAEIMRQRKGKGLDLVMNSRMDQKLQLGDHILSTAGKILESSRYLQQNAYRRINSSLEHYELDVDMRSEFNKLWELLLKGIKEGAYKPIPNKCYPSDMMKQAIEDLKKEEGFHSKVLIKIRDEKQEKGPTTKILKPVLPSTRCSPIKTYIITGGLGGFGLELADWLVDRGARHLVLTSRSGIRNGYQARKIRLLQEQQIDVQVSTHDMTTESGCLRLVEDSNKQGPVGGIFHLAMVLKDGFIENQTNEMYQDVLGTKVAGTIHLDNWSSTLCKQLDWFVVFSSVSSGRGNAGQSNYGYGNSVMERICEKRRAQGLPGLAIQWGVIGDVGVAVERFGDKMSSVGGTLPQRISSCLDTLDHFLCQSSPVVSSFVPASRSRKSGKSQETAERSLVESVMKVLGVQDLNSICPESSLLDMGLDSLMGVEIKQIMENQYNINMSLPNIRVLTFKKLVEMSDSKGSKKTSDMNQNVIKQEDGLTDQKMLSFTLPKDCVVKLSEGKSDKSPVIVLHSLDGSFGKWGILGDILDNPVFGIQSTATTPMMSVKSMAGFYLQNIFGLLQQRMPFYIIGVSYSCLVALEIINLLQRATDQFLYTLVAVDSSPEVLPELGGVSLDEMLYIDPGERDCLILNRFMKLLGIEEQKLQQDVSLEVKLGQVVNAIRGIQESLCATEILHAAKNFHQRALMALQYSGINKTKGDVVLIGAKTTDSVFCKDHPDYNWQKYCEGKVEKHSIDFAHTDMGSTASIKAVAEIIRKIQDVS